VSEALDKGSHEHVLIIDFSKVFDKWATAFARSTRLAAKYW